MLGEPKYRRPLIGLVGADPLERSGAVVETVGQDMDGGVVPIDELPVHPDVLGGLHSPIVPQNRRAMATASDRFEHGEHDGGRVGRDVVEEPVEIERCVSACEIR